MALQSQWQESDPPEENWDSGNEWPVAGIVNEEEDSFSIKRYEVKWATWNREDGTNTTWERGEHVEELIKKWDTKQSDKRAMFARDSLSMIVRTDPEHLLHQDTTIELAQGLHEKIRAARRRDLAECYSGWDDIEHLTSSDNEDADDHPRHGPAQPRLQRRSSSTVVVQVPVLPKRASTSTTPTRNRTASSLVSVKISQSGGSSAQSGTVLSSHQIPGRPTKSLPKHHVKTNSPETGKKAASASISPKYGPPNRRRIHLSERWTQAARRAGAAPVTVVNTVNREDIPPSLDGFEYCERHYVRGSQVPEMDDAASCLVTCDCNVCHNAALCGCQDPSELTDDYGEKELAYTDDGLFKFNLPQGVEVIECNRGCKCNRNTCPNRVAQRPRDVPIEVFRTDACGWGVRATVDLVKGKVMGIHTGELIPRTEADKRTGDRKAYIFDLDMRESEDDNEGDQFSVDSWDCGNWTRFINHSCEPNMRVYPVIWDTIPEANQPYLAFVTTRNLPANTELTIDYDPKAASAYKNSKGKAKAKMPPGAQPCVCATESCRGWFKTPL